MFSHCANIEIIPHFANREMKEISKNSYFYLVQLHIIHLKKRKDRAQLLNKELIEQDITNFKIWEGILDEEHPKRGIAKAHKTNN